MNNFSNQPYIVPPCNKPVGILYVDDTLVVANKPEFLLSVPGRHKDNNDCVLNRIVKQFSDALLVHRLDLDTSGIMIFARNPYALKHLNRQFQLRAVKKQYAAVCIGPVREQLGGIDLPLSKDRPNAPRQKIDFVGGKSSLTYYRNEGPWAESPNQATRLTLYPQTGRTHQLRMHMRMIGHAIVGCDLYGTETAYNLSERLLLHASKIEFQHPKTEKTIVIESPVPF